MYTMINYKKSEDVNLISLEDPVEYHIDGVCQVQINEKVDLTFANALRAVLRQDPDIIAVGEIRDGETAEIAMRAAMTCLLYTSCVGSVGASRARYGDVVATGFAPENKGIITKSYCAMSIDTEGGAESFGFSKDATTDCVYLNDGNFAYNDKNLSLIHI